MYLVNLEKQLGRLQTGSADAGKWKFRINISLRLVVLAALPLMFAGCQAKTVSSIDGSDVATPELDAQALAVQAKDELFSRLSGRLMEVMQANGPVAAINVCSSEALEIAKVVGDEQGVLIGRTSLKLRNPANQPPAWAAAAVSEAKLEPQFLELADGHTGALFPIMLQAQCLMCHGPRDQIGDPLLQQLDKHYPTDQATGFREGDLRGWFWVNVPLPLETLGQE